MLARHGMQSSQARAAARRLRFQLGVLGHAQAKRLQSFRTKGETGLLGMAPFDPLGLRDDYKRQSEVRCCHPRPNPMSQPKDPAAVAQPAHGGLRGVHWKPAWPLAAVANRAARCECDLKSAPHAPSAWLSAACCNMTVFRHISRTCSFSMQTAWQPYCERFFLGYSAGWLFSAAVVSQELA